MDAAPMLCVDVRRAAEMLSVSEWTVRAFIAAGTLPVVKLPSVDGTTTNRRVLLAVADLAAFVKKHTERAG